MQKISKAGELRLEYVVKKNRLHTITVLLMVWFYFPETVLLEAALRYTFYLTLNIEPLINLIS